MDDFDGVMIAYSPDQERTDEGKFEDEGMGHGPGDKNAPGTKQPEQQAHPTPVKYHGKVSAKAQERVEASIKSLPLWSQETIGEVQVHEGNGPASNYEGGSQFKVGGTFEQRSGRMTLYNAEEFGGMRGGYVTDAIVGHEAGHAVQSWSIHQSQENWNSFREASISEGMVSEYAAKHYASDFPPRGIDENFAEWHGLYHLANNGRAEGLTLAAVKYPQSAAAFDKMWVKAGGKKL